MANTAAEFEKAIGLLQQADPTGSTLYDHVTRLLLKIAKDKPDNALENLEAISVSVKKAALPPNIYKELAERRRSPEDKQQKLTALENTLTLFKKIPYFSTDAKVQFLESLADYAKAMEDDEIEDEKKPKLPTLPGHYVPDIMGHQRLLNLAGVGLPEEEVYRISLSVQNLAREKDFATIRFFGKILGINKNYYVCEAKLKSYPKGLKENPVTKAEPSGVGLNEYIYLVTNSPEAPWVQLPDVVPEQILTARQMRRFLTGDLKAPVLGYPRFPFPEASYLRCQIARISAATVVSPKGFYTMETLEPPEDEEDAEEVEVMIEDAEFEPPGMEEMLTPESWCHHRAHILKQGRAKPWAPPEGEEEDEPPEGEEEEEEEPEEALPLLGGLEADALPLPPGVEDAGDDDDPLKEKLWLIKAYPEGGTNQVAVARNMSWPGSYAVAQGKVFTNIYVGWGAKYKPELYAPPPPPAVLGEYKSAWNPEEAEEGETDPMVEQIDPQPPKAAADEGDEGEDGDEEEEE